MKYRFIGIMMMALMLLGTIIAVQLDTDNGFQRVHQHRTARQPDAGCDCDGSTLCTHLPLVIIDTSGQTVPGKYTGQMDSFGQRIYTSADDGNKVITVSVSVVDQQSRNNHPSDEAAFTTLSEFRIRGNSSREFDKKQYLLNFINEDGSNKDYEVMGMASHHEWVLNGPYLDKSLMRNYIWYNIAGEIMDYAPNVRYCEVIVDGKYCGLYLMVESITDGESGRLPLSTSAQNKEISGYLLRLDRLTEEELSDIRDADTYLELSGQLKKNISVRYPKRTKLTEEMRGWIERDFSQFERALYSYDYDDRRYGYKSMIDVNNFVDYYIINELAANVDAANYSTYIYKAVGEPYRLCVWDFNNAFDNYQRDVVLTSELFLHERTFYYMLFKDEDFVTQVIARYRELRESYLSDAYLSDYIDETVAYLGDAIDRNFEVWGASFEDDSLMTPVERNIRSYDEAVTQLKNYLLERADWMDRNIETLQQYSHPSHTKSYDY